MPFPLFVIKSRLLWFITKPPQAANYLLILLTERCWLSHFPRTFFTWHTPFCSQLHKRGKKSTTGLLRFSIFHISYLNESSACNFCLHRFLGVKISWVFGSWIESKNACKEVVLSVSQTHTLVVNQGMTYVTPSHSSARSPSLSPSLSDIVPGCSKCREPDYQTQTI